MNYENYRGGGAFTNKKKTNLFEVSLFFIVQNYFLSLLFFLNRKKLDIIATKNITMARWRIISSCERSGFTFPPHEKRNRRKDIAKRKEMKNRKKNIL